jgi:hypothetical protein
MQRTSWAQIAEGLSDLIESFPKQGDDGSTP